MVASNTAIVRAMHKVVVVMIVKIKATEKVDTGEDKEKVWDLKWEKPVLTMITIHDQMIL